jgi:hypothetical protein
MLIAIATTSCSVSMCSGCRSSGSSKVSATTESSALPQSDPSQVNWKAPIDVAIGDARAGPWRMNESDFDYLDDPTVALREDGLIGVTWADNDRKDIFFQVYGSDGKPRLVSAINVSRSPRIFSWLPRMLVTSDDRVFVLWQEIVFSGGSHGGEVFFSHSSDGGRSFSDPNNLSNSIGGDGKGRLTKEHWDNGSLDLVRGEDGELFAAWTEYAGVLWFSRSTDGGRSFSAPSQVDGSSERPARGPSLATSHDGTLYLAWTVGEEASADIRFAILRRAATAFEPPRIVFKSQGHSDTPKIGIDDDGVVHLVCSESSTGPFGSSQVRYTRLTHANGSFEQPRIISAPDPTQSAASAPSLSLGAAGSVYVVWQHHADARKSARGLGFALSRDGGQTFTSPSLVPGISDANLGVNGSRQGKLMRLLAVNKAGTIAVVNSRFRKNERSRILLVVGQDVGR